MLTWAIEVHTPYWSLRFTLFPYLESLAQFKDKCSVHDMYEYIDMYMKKISMVFLKLPKALKK